MAYHDGIHRLDHTNESISCDIRALFQCAYRVEAEIVGVEHFPPLNRTVENIRITDSVFTGLFAGSALTAVSETRTDGNCLFIDSFVVDPRFFRKGFGSQLLQSILHESHCDQASVDTAAGNEAAIRFYRRFGFTAVERWKTEEGMQLVRLGAKLDFNRSTGFE